MVLKKTKMEDIGDFMWRVATFIQFISINYTLDRIHELLEKKDF